MSILTISHTHSEGTLIDGTARDDGSAEALKLNRWRWSRKLGSWYVPHSRDRLAKRTLINSTAASLRAAGFDVEVAIDDTYRPPVNVETDKIERQKDRVDALDAKADRKAASAENAWSADEAAHAALPEGGEPIKVGHHSERRHRNALDKAWNTLGKAVAAEREASNARGRADAAAHTTEARYAPVAVTRRVERLEAELRRLERTRDGYKRTLFTNGQTGQKYVEEHEAATGEHRARLLADIDHTADTLAYWQGVAATQIATGKAIAYTRDLVVSGDQIRYAGHWHPVVRVNGKSVTITSIVGGSWTDRVAYGEIRGLRDVTGTAISIVDGHRVPNAPVAS